MKILWQVVFSTVIILNCYDVQAVCVPIENIERTLSTHEIAHIKSSLKMAGNSSKLDLMSNKQLVESFCSLQIRRTDCHSVSISSAEITQMCLYHTADKICFANTQFEMTTPTMEEMKQALAAKGIDTGENDNPQSIQELYCRHFPQTKEECLTATLSLPISLCEWEATQLEKETLIPEPAK